MVVKPYILTFVLSIGSPKTYETKLTLKNMKKSRLILCCLISLSVVFGNIATAQAGRKSDMKVNYVLKNIGVKSDVRENKLKMFIVKNFPYIPKLLKLKQADFSAGKDDLSVAPTVIKWNNLIRKMQDEGVPFSLKELNISALDLQTLGYKDKEIGETLDFLWRETILNPRLNDREKLLTIAAKRKGNG